MAYFRFPKGVEAVSVEQQEFASVFTDRNGANYCTAPDHFAPKLLEIGFVLVDKPSEAPGDTATEELLANDSIRELGRHLDGLRQENLDLRSTLETLQKDFLALKTENEGLKAQLEQKPPAEATAEAAETSSAAAGQEDGAGADGSGANNDPKAKSSSITGLAKSGK
jgi:regulator of replication initiation timing